MRNKHKFLYAFLLVVLASFLLFFFQSNTIKNINELSFGKNGDGIKNYYTVIYHVLHDSTYNHFEGMNYPYGEHILYTDNQPILSNTLKFIDNNIFPLESYLVGVINFIMLLSILLTTIVLYLIFCHLKLHNIYAIILAIGVSFLSPQLPRMFGHYGLSYSFIIPLIILLLLKLNDSKKIYSSYFIALIVCASAGIHFYYFAILTSLLILNNIFIALYKWNTKQFIFNILIQIVLPTIVVFAYLKLTDNIVDRPKHPSGFFNYISTWESVFLPLGLPLESYFHEFVEDKKIAWEGISYVGINASIFCLCSFLLLLFKKTRDYIFSIKQLTSLFFSSIILLLLAMGYPFVFNLEYLLDYITPLKQFRSIGRFAWVFFFTINLLIYHFINQFSGVKKHVFFAIAITILYYDVYQYNRKKINLYEKSVNNDLINNSIKKELNHIDFKKYQAIIPLPYYHIGSETITKDVSDYKLMQNVFVFSCSTGLPTTAVVMSRTSYSQTKNQFNFINLNYASDFITNLNSKKPFLVISRKESKLNYEQANILKYSEKISIYNDFELFSLSIDSLKAKQHDDLVYNTKNLYQQNNLFSSDSVINYLFLGNNRVVLNKEGFFIKNSPILLSETEKYEISFWAKFEPYPNPFSRFDVAIKDSVGGIIDYFTSNFGESFHVSNSDSALIVKEFLAPKQSFNVSMYFHPNLSENISFSNLLIRPINKDVLYETKNVLVKNNRIVTSK